MTTDKTQELDDRQHIKFNILVPFLTAITIKRQKEKGSRIKDTETAYYDFAVDLITDWHNKQIEAVLDRLHSKPPKNNWLQGSELFYGFDEGVKDYQSDIQSERKKLGSE